MNQGWHSAREIVGRLKGRWSGSSGTCRCPAHEDRSPSLSVTQTRDGRVLVRCHAGCGQREVIQALQILQLWPDGSPVGDPSYPGRMTTPHDYAFRERGEREMRESAQAVWDAARPAKGTVVEEYLAARGIRPPPTIWGELRYSPRLKHAPSGQHFRAMIARISDDRGFCAIQRTYLDKDKLAKADVMPNKMSKGPMGGGAVRFRMPTETLGIAEGIETALSAWRLYSMPVWATLSCTRLARIEIPKTVKSLSIFGDADKHGKAEAFAAVEVYERQGLHVELFFPGSDFKVTDKADFNTILKENAARKYD